MLGRGAFRMAWIEKFCRDFMDGWGLVVINLPSMLVEVLLIGGGLSLALVLFSRRSEKRELAKMLAGHTHNFLVHTLNTIQSLRNGDLEGYQSNKTGMNSSKGKIKESYLPYSKLLGKLENSAYERYIELVEKLHSCVWKQLLGGDPNSQDEGDVDPVEYSGLDDIAEKILAEFRQQPQNPFSGLHTKWSRMTTLLWGLTLVPKVFKSWSVKGKLIKTIDANVAGILESQPLSKRQHSFGIRVVGTSELDRWDWQGSPDKGPS